MDIGSLMIDTLFQKLMCPLIRPNANKIIAHIFRSSKSQALFSKVEPLIPTILQNFSDIPLDSSAQQSIDLIYMLCNTYDIKNYTIVR